MAVPQSITSELQKVAPSSIIELFQLQLFASLHGANETYYFHAGVNGKGDGGNVIWAGQAYAAFPVEVDGFEYSGNGQLPRPRVKASNQLGLMTSILISVNSFNPGNDLLGAKLTRIRTCARYLDAANFPGNVNPYGTPDTTAEFPREIYYVSRKVTENRDLVEFECAAAFDLQGVKAPRRQCIANICQWVYRSAECGYTGNSYFNVDDSVVLDPALDECGKRLSSCEARFGPATITGSVTAGSTTMTGISTTEAARIRPGDPIEGPGLPSGTLVTSEPSGSLTLSKAATASTSGTTRTGTLSATGLQLTVSSASGLAPGMGVSGANVPSGTTISSISGNVLTLSISYNPFTRGSAETRNVTVTKTATTETWSVSNTSGILVGDLAGNNEGVSLLVPQGTNIYKGTKVSQVTTNTSVRLSRLSKFSNGATFTAIFWRPATFTSSSYSFTLSNKYVVRPRGRIPFGSFPGVGSYYS